MYKVWNGNVLVGDFKDVLLEVTDRVLQIRQHNGTRWTPVAEFNNRGGWTHWAKV